GREMFETWYKMIALVQGPLDVSGLITHRIGVEDYIAGIEAMKSGNSGKVAKDWRGALASFRNNRDFLRGRRLCQIGVEGCQCGPDSQSQSQINCIIGRKSMTACGMENVLVRSGLVDSG